MWVIVILDTVKDIVPKAGDGLWSRDSGVPDRDVGTDTQCSLTVEAMVCSPFEREGCGAYR